MLHGNPELREGTSVTFRQDGYSQEVTIESFAPCCTASVRHIQQGRRQESYANILYPAMLSVDYGAHRIPLHMPRGGLPFCMVPLRLDAQSNVLLANELTSVLFCGAGHET